jgi:hypothetical protein
MRFARRSCSVRKYVASAALVGLVALPFFATETACFPQSMCELSYGRYCTEEATGIKEGCTGQLLDDGLTWVSGPIEGAWLPFPRERIWRVDPRDAAGNKLRGRIVGLDVFISATQDHAAAAPAAGNNAQWSYYPTNQTFDVQNDTCSDYVVYIVIHASLDGDAAVLTAPDAGRDAGDAGDAGGDAGADAALDAASE